MPPTYRAFHQHVKRAHLQSLFCQTNKTVIEMKNPENFGWKFDGTRYIAIATDNPIAPDTVISLALCKSEGNTFYFRSSRPEVFLRKGVLKICSKFTGEHSCRSVISIKLLCNFN